MGIADQVQQNYNLIADGNAMDDAIVSQQVALIMDSPAFKRAPRMRKFLHYIIGEKLAGREKNLKEYSIGIAVFDRPSDFDPHTSPIVRVEAARLRRCLADYYSQSVEDPLIVIKVPKGGYVPQFHVMSRTLKTEKPRFTERELRSEDAIATSGADLREVTVLSCGIESCCDSSLAAEEYSDKFRIFHDLIRSIASQYSGSISLCTGDCFSVCFGWPQAKEGDADRAVIAGLDIVNAFHSNISDENYVVRVGIATGEVVSEDRMYANSAELIGMVPSLARRVMRHASHNEIILANTTFSRLVNKVNAIEAGSYSEEDGTQFCLWKLLDTDPSCCRFLSKDRLEIPLIARREELAFLLRRWREAVYQNDKTTIVIGEAGIGKSRLIQAFTERTTTRTRTLIFQCFSYHIDSPFHPVIAWLQKHGELLKTHLNERKRQLVNDYLNGKLEEAGGYQNAAILRDEVFDVFVELFSTISNEEELILIFEDLQWSDPTTIEFLKRLCSAYVEERILIIVSSRSTNAATFLPNAKILSLKNLSKQQSAEIIEHIANKMTITLSQNVREEIVGKADGIPLYIEELTKSFLSSPDGRFIPSTLINLLTAQIDKLGSVRSFAQVAAVIGRTFDRTLLSEVMSLPQVRVDDGILCLLESDVLVERGFGDGRHLMFRHALLRDAAYESMTPQTRQQWHARVAAILEASHPDLVFSNPELIARHWQDANIQQKAVPLLLSAGQKEARRFANAEALNHLRKGLKLVRDMPASNEWCAYEAKFLVEIALLLRMSFGYGHAELGDICEYANTLSSKLGISEVQGDSIFGLWTFAASRADWKTAENLTSNYALLPQVQSNQNQQVECWRLKGTNAVYQGRFNEAFDCLKMAVDLYEPDSFDPKFGYDAKATSLTYLSWASLFGGRKDDCSDYIQNAINWADIKEHEPTIALVLAWTMLPMVSMRKFDEILQNNKRLVSLCEKNDLKHWKAFGAGCAAWARFSLSGDIKLIASIFEASDEFQTHWGTFLRPCFHLLVADAYLQIGQVDKAREFAELASAFQKEHGEFLLEDEVRSILVRVTQFPNVES